MLGFSVRFSQCSSNACDAQGDKALLVEPPPLSRTRVPLWGTRRYGFPDDLAFEGGGLDSEASRWPRTSPCPSFTQAVMQISPRMQWSRTRAPGPITTLSGHMPWQVPALTAPLSPPHGEHSDRCDHKAGIGCGPSVLLGSSVARSSPRISALGPGRGALDWLRVRGTTSALPFCSLASKKVQTFREEGPVLWVSEGLWSQKGLRKEVPARVGEHGSKKLEGGMFWKGEGRVAVFWQETCTHEGGGVRQTPDPAEGAGGRCGLSQEPRGWWLVQAL